MTLSQAQNYGYRKPLYTTKKVKTIYTTPLMSRFGAQMLSQNDPNRGTSWTFGASYQRSRGGRRSTMLLFSRFQLSYCRIYLFLNTMIAAGRTEAIGFAYTYCRDGNNIIVCDMSVFDRSAYTNITIIDTGWALALLLSRNWFPNKL